MTKNIFKEACRLDPIFNYKGQIKVRDLWSLDLVALDSIYRSLNSDLSKEVGDSLLGNKSFLVAELELKIALVKEIFADKREQAAKAQNKQFLQQQRAEIISALEEKAKDVLTNLSPAELAQKAKEIEEKLKEVD